MVTILNRDSITDAGVFLSRQLEQRLPGVYGKKYPTLQFANGTLLPATADLEVGAESVIEEVSDTLGKSEIVSDYTDEIPYADAYITQNKFPVVVRAVAIRYSVRELAAAQKGNRNIRGMREMSARRVLEEGVNQLAAFGAPGISGMLNDPSVPLANDSTAVYTVDADALVNFFSTNVAKIVSDSNMAEAPDTIVLPVTLHERMTNLRLPNSPHTVKSFILENSMWIKNIIPANELSAANLQAFGIGDGTKDRILIYPRNPETVQRLFEPLTILPPQLNNLTYRVIMLAASTGAIFHYPAGCMQVSVAKPA
jgi:hypothetical protein